MKNQNQNRYGQSLSFNDWNKQKESLKKVCENESGVTKMLFDENNKPHSERVKESEEGLSHYEGFLYRSLKSRVSSELEHKFKFTKKDINKIMVEMESSMCGLVMMKNFHKMKINEGDTYFERYL